MTKKVVLVVASNGFQQKEYHDTYAVLVKAGVQITTASDKKGQAIAHDGSMVHVDMLIEDIQPILFDGVFFIGGRGALKCLNTPVSYKLLNELMAVGKPYGAICIAPRILAWAHVLKGKKATCWNDDEVVQDIFDAQGVTFVHESVVTDGNVVTANGPLAATDFGHAIVKVL